jgi:hypothetical protein
VFGGLFYVAYANWIRACAALSITLLSGIFLQAYLLHSPLQTHIFLLTTALLMLVLFILTLSPTKNSMATYYKH